MIVQEPGTIQVLDRSQTSLVFEGGGARWWWWRKVRRGSPINREGGGLKMGGRGGRWCGRREEPAGGGGFGEVPGANRGRWRRDGFAGNRQPMKMVSVDQRTMKIQRTGGGQTVDGRAILARGRWTVDAGGRAELMAEASRRGSGSQQGGAPRGGLEAETGDDGGDGVRWQTRAMEEKGGRDQTERRMALLIKGGGWTCGRMEGW